MCRGGIHNEEYKQAAGTEFNMEYDINITLTLRF